MQSGKDKTATPSTTPATSGAEGGSDALDVSISSIRQSDAGPGVLTSAVLESAFLYKQPSKRRLFGVSNAQKRFFALTANELAYREKDTEDAEYKVVWKLTSDLIKVEIPEADSKDFGLVVMEGGAQRTVRLSAADSETAMKFATAVSAALKQASVSVVTPAVSGSELAIADAKPTLMETSIAEESSVIASGDEASEIQPKQETEATEEAVEGQVVESASVEALVAAESLDAVELSKTVSKPAVWFWGMCCSAE